MCDFCERILCELFERVLCVSSMCILCVSSGANQTSSPNKKTGGQLRPIRQVRRKKHCWGSRKTTGAQELCASSACEFYWQTNWGPTEANQTSSPKDNIFGTTGDHGSASSVCELCLPVLLVAATPRT